MLIQFILNNVVMLSLTNTKCLQMPVTGYIQLWLNKNSEFGYIQVMLMLMFQSQAPLHGLKDLDNNKE